MIRNGKAMAKKLYFGSNLKMYKNTAATVSYLQALEEKIKDIPDITRFIIPSYTTLESASKAVNHKNILIGAQNMCYADEGQFTGEISPLMLKELGIDLVMIGHSERRHVFGEKDSDENLKVLTALKHGFTTLLCIGETAEEKNYGISVEILRQQLKIGLFGVALKDIDRLWIAYEPVWSIGVGGTPASPEYAEEMHHEIKNCLFELFGEQAAQIPVLYGGSVNPGNADELIVQEDIDGLFVGRAAWDAAKFDALIRQALRAYHS